VDTGSGRGTTYAYDGTDQLAEALGPDGTALTVLRDAFGRARAETVAGRTPAFTYDESRRRASRTTPTGATTSWSYDAAGRELTRRMGETVSLEYGFDAVGRLTSQAVLGAGRQLVQSRGYTYRPDGNLTGIDDLLSGSRRSDLDTAGRVTAVHATHQVKHPCWWDENAAPPQPGDRLHVVVLDADRDPPRLSALSGDIDIARRLRGIDA
jgi:YD repeat-containing protein